MRTLNVWTLFVLTLGCFPASDQPKTDNPIRGDDKQLHGKWSVVAFDYQGYWLSAAGPIGEYYRSLRVTFSDKKILIGPGKNSKPPPGLEFSWHHAYEANPNAEPKQIDIRQLGVTGDGKLEEFGNVWPGIYELDGDRLVICVKQWNGSRPKEFSTKGRTTIMLLEREK